MSTGRTYSHNPGDMIGTRYRVTTAVGRGGYGSVYQAKRLDDGLPVAVKVMHEKLGASAVAYRRFEREASLVQRMKHPHIVQLLDFAAPHGELPYIVFELLSGHTLRQELDGRGSLGVVRCAQIARQLLSALAFAHSEGVVHRDVKPANVFLCNGLPADQQVKVLDFGIAKASNEGGALTTLTATGQMLGTPQYMAPEQVRGAKDIDGRADVYAVGTLMSEMITGSKLVVADTDIEVFMAHISGEPLTIPPEVETSVLGALIARAVAKLREQRYPSAQAMLADLDAVLPTITSNVDPTWTDRQQPALASADTISAQYADTDHTRRLQPAPPAQPSHPSAYPAAQPQPYFSVPPPAAQRPAPGPRRGTTNHMPLIVVGAVGAALVLALGSGVLAWSLARSGVDDDDGVASTPIPSDDKGTPAFPPESVRSRLRRAGIHIAEEDFTPSPYVDMWIMQLRREDSHGIIQMFNYSSKTMAKQSAENFTTHPTFAWRRKGTTIIAVSWPEDADGLLRSLTR